MNSLSTLGIFHTLITVLALVFAIVAFVADRRIDPRNWRGQGYVVTNVVGCLMTFGLARHGHFGIGHVLSVIVLVLIAAGYATAKRPLFRDAAFTGSVFISLIPATTETLTRLPVEHPLATGPEDALVRGAIAAWAVIFAIGFAMQTGLLRKLRVTGG